MNRPRTRLFLIQSIDGKITGGSGDTRDFDVMLPSRKGHVDGMRDYYMYEQNTDEYSLITGRIVKKLYNMNGAFPGHYVPVNYVLYDTDKVTCDMLESIAGNCKSLIYVSSEEDSYYEKQSFCEEHSIHTLLIERNSHMFEKLFNILYDTYNVKEITVQSGGTLNSLLFEEDLIDNIDLFIAPIIVGGFDTPTLVDGRIRFGNNVRADLRDFKLVEMRGMSDSYILLRYERN